MAKENAAKDEPLIDINDPATFEDEGTPPGDAPAGPDGTPPPAGGATDINAIIAERDEFKDRFIRALADAENSRKRSERDRKEAEQYGGSKLARDMLPVYDNLKRAMEHVTPELREANAAFLEGIELTLKEIVNVFAKHGIKVIAPEVGDRFDPNEHQAMFEAPVPGTKAGDIIQVMAEGFVLYDRLLRAAQVGVSSTPG